MKNLFLFFCLLCTIVCHAADDTRITSIKKVADGLYMMYYDTSSIKKTVSKSAIVEFKDYIVLLEMPIAYSNSNIYDHTEGGEKVLAALKKQFPNKSLKYVVSSHWHPHSISSVLPFISRGITVITTRNNFKKLSEFVDSATYRKYSSYIRFVDEDSMVIRDKKNSIVIYKCSKEDYSYIPTDDFLYCYLPKYKCLQTSCMYQRFGGAKTRGKELVSGRSENLYEFTQLKTPDVAHLLCTETYDDDSTTGMIAADTLRSMMQNGIGMVSLERGLLSISNETYASKGDSLLKELVINPMPGSVINSAVYTCLRRDDLPKALALAKLHALLSPSDPNSWDTYGEVYYFMGETKMADRYEAQSNKIDKNFTRGGKKGWQTDLENYRQIWDKK